MQALSPPWPVCWGSASGQTGEELPHSGKAFSQPLSPVNFCICVVLGRVEISSPFLNVQFY